MGEINRGTVKANPSNITNTQENIGAEEGEERRLVLPKNRPQEKGGPNELGEICPKRFNTWPSSGYLS